MSSTREEGIETVGDSGPDRSVGRATLSRIMGSTSDVCTSQVMESAPARGGLNRAHLQCRNLQEFLGGLSPGVLDRLYGHPATCLAVFR